MKLNRKLDSKEQIPKGLEALYKEKDGAFVLDVEVEGMKSAEDFSTLNSELTRTKTELSTFKDKFKHFEELDPSEVLKNLDKLKELEQKGVSKLDDEAIEKIANIRTKELERKLKDVELQLEGAVKENSSLKTEQQNHLLTRAIKDVIFDPDSKENRVYDGVVRDIEIRAERDLEYSPELKKFVTKDDEKLSAQEWYDKQIKDGALWEKGSRGEPDGNGKSRVDGKHDGTIEENIAEIWGNQ